MKLFYIIYSPDNNWSTKRKIHFFPAENFYEAEKEMEKIVPEESKQRNHFVLDYLDFLGCSFIGLTSYPENSIEHLWVFEVIDRYRYKYSTFCFSIGKDQYEALHKYKERYEKSSRNKWDPTNIMKVERIDTVADYAVYVS